MPRIRWTRVGKWAGMVGCALVVAAFAANLRWTALWAWPNGLGIGMNDGIEFVGREAPGHPEFTIGPCDARFRWWFQLSRGRGSWFVGVPHWAALLFFAIPTTYLWQRDLRCSGPGRCQRCGYDLAGLPAGAVCPECGRGAA